MVETAATARVGFDRNKTSGSPYPLILSPVHCGVYTATLRLMAFSDLWTSDYGRTLFAKLVLFGVTIAFGAYHLLIVRPQT
ncbi:MAG: CopD family protein, partial [Roseiflexaceae bacterium]|nr:CopD family protein [Roseiflexaceae bacterium]